MKLPLEVREIEVRTARVAGTVLVTSTMEEVSVRMAAAANCGLMLVAV